MGRLAHQTHPRWGYIGQWRLGKFHGRGMKTGSDSARYTGEFVDGKEHGHGVAWKDDDHYYEGLFKDGRQHGLGVLTPALL